MGMRGAADLQAALLQGLAAKTPVAIVQNVSLSNQRHAVCTLLDLHDTVMREGLGSPSVIVVGDVLQGLLALQQKNTQHPSCI